jgi:hypothetical protein
MWATSRTLRPGTASVAIGRREAGPAGLEFIAVGPHHGSDGEQVDDPWIAAGRPLVP